MFYKCGVVHVESGQQIGLLKEGNSSSSSNFLGCRSVSRRKLLYRSLCPKVITNVIVDIL